MKLPSKGTLLNIVLIVLLIVAGVLGYLVYQKFVPTEIKTETDDRSSNTAQQNGQPLSAEASEFASMSDAELVRVMPGSGDVSEATLQAYSTQTNERAVATDRITIAEGCQIEPAIVSVPLGGTITFVNQSQVTQRLMMSQDWQVAIDAGQTREVIIDYETGQGVYGYSCDGLQALTGILLVQ